MNISNEYLFIFLYYYIGKMLMEPDGTLMFVKRINEYINKWTTVLMYPPSLGEFLDWVPQPFSVAECSLQIRSYQLGFVFGNH